MWFGEQAVMLGAQLFCTAERKMPSSDALKIIEALKIEREVCARTCLRVVVGSTVARQRLHWVESDYWCGGGKTQREDYWCEELTSRFARPHAVQLE